MANSHDQSQNDLVPFSNGLLISPSCNVTSIFLEMENSRLKLLFGKCHGKWGQSDLKTQT